MRKLNVVTNHKKDYVRGFDMVAKRAEVKEKVFIAHQQHTKATLNKAFVNPLLKVNIQTGEVLINRISETYEINL